MALKQAPNSVYAPDGSLYITLTDGAGNLVTTGSGGSGTVTSVSVTTANGVSGSVATATTTPAISLTLGAITPTTVNGNTFTSGTYTLTGVAGKTLTFNNSITLSGTDSTTYTFPTTSATIARTDAGQTFTGTNVFGVTQATSLALGGATIGSNALAVTGTALFNSQITAGGGVQLGSNQVLTSAGAQVYIGASFTGSTVPVAIANSNTNLNLELHGTSSGSSRRSGMLFSNNTGGVYTKGFEIGTDSANNNTNDFYWFDDVQSIIKLYLGAGSPYNVGIGSAGSLGFSSTTSASGSLDTVLTRQAAATLHHGAADAAAPVAQTLGVQSVVAGTSNTAGTNWTLVGSLSTGSGISGDIVFQTGGTGAASTAQNTSTTSLTLKGATQRVVANAPVGFKAYTVSTLPAGVVGDNAYVTDALAPSFLVTIAGGGSVVTPVFYNGTNWVGA